jgi:hypothetical protein
MPLYKGAEISRVAGAGGHWPVGPSDSGAAGGPARPAQARSTEQTLSTQAAAVLVRHGRPARTKFDVPLCYKSLPRKLSSASEFGASVSKRNVDIPSRPFLQPRTIEPRPTGEPRDPII